MRAPSLGLFVFLALALGERAAAAEKAPSVAGTLMLGWNQRPHGSRDAVPSKRREGGPGVTGTLVYQGPGGWGIGGTTSFSAIERIHEKATRPPCASCEYERTTLSYGVTAWELGVLARWLRPEGELRPSVQWGLSFGQLRGDHDFGRTTTGLTLHMGLGAEWRLFEGLPVALRAELRGTGGLYAGDDFVESAYWTGFLLGAGF